MSRYKYYFTGTGYLSNIATIIQIMHFCSSCDTCQSYFMFNKKKAYRKEIFG